MLFVSGSYISPKTNYRCRTVLPGLAGGWAFSQRTCGLIRKVATIWSRAASYGFCVFFRGPGHPENLHLSRPCTRHGPILNSAIGWMISALAPPHSASAMLSQVRTASFASESFHPVRLSRCQSRGSACSAFQRCYLYCNIPRSQHCRLLGFWNALALYAFDLAVVGCSVS